MNAGMSIEVARAAVRQFVWNGTDETATAQREAIAQHMAATGTCVLHACWELYGKPKGAPCWCSPCIDAREAVRS